MSAIRKLIRPRLRLVLVILLLLALGVLWLVTRLSKPLGDQIVDFVPAHKQCFEHPGPPAWRTCIYRAAGGTNDGLAYVLHGRNLDEHVWNDNSYYTSQIQRYWQDHRLKSPTVVVVSFGPVWILTPKNSAPKSGLLDLFIEQVIPEVERRTGKPRYRVLIGTSMGGLNALLLGLQQGELFPRAIALCPVVYKQTPFDSWSEMHAFLKRTGAYPKVILGLRKLAREFATNLKEWRQMSPIDLLKTIDTSKSAELYLSVGLYDRYGNFEGTQLFAEAAARKGIKITWRPMYGGHCSIDIASAAQALLL